MWVGNPQKFPHRNQPMWRTDGFGNPLLVSEMDETTSALVKTKLRTKYPRIMNKSLIPWKISLFCDYNRVYYCEKIVVYLFLLVFKYYYLVYFFIYLSILVSHKIKHTLYRRNKALMPRAVYYDCSMTFLIGRRQLKTES